MGRDLGIADRLRAKGLMVEEVFGWQDRGSATSFGPQVSVNHHTAGGPNGARPSLGVCINGRAGLAGPLCNVFQDRDNVVLPVASGKANHAGEGGWAGFAGNNAAYGLEVENVGYADREPWRDDQVETMAKVHAALIEGQFGVDRVCQHREWAPNRKIDAQGLNTDDFRALVAHYLGQVWTPPTAPPPSTYPLLRRGDTGDYVGVAQERLDVHGFSQPDDLYRIFGEDTERAVVEFQRKHGLDDDGKIGPQTWPVLLGAPSDTPAPAPPPPPPPPAPVTKRPVLRVTSPMMKGTHVLYCQDRVILHGHGGYGMRRDGVYGPKTRERVQSFQREQRLKPDGIVGPLTWARLG